MNFSVNEFLNLVDDYEAISSILEAVTICQV